jgi:hypothetical protein
MGYNLTPATKNAASDNQKRINLIFDIEGYEEKFSFFRDLKTLRFDEGYFFDDSPTLFFDTKVANINTLPLISLEGTSTTVTQQIDQDLSTGSTPSMNIAMVDLNGKLTELFGNDEMLGRRANVYLSFAQLEHPTDSIRIFSGTISRLKVIAGKWIFRVDNPDYLKNQKLFFPYTDELTGSLGLFDTTVNVSDTGTFIESGGALVSHIKIGSEIMEVVGINPTSFEVTRGALDTSAQSHSVTDEVASIYQLVGNPLDVALAIMLSKQGSDAYYTENVDSFVTGSGGNILNSFYIDVFNAGDEKGITEGDTVTIAGSNGADGTYLITGVSLQPANYTNIQVNGTLTEAQWQAGTTASFFTQYNTMPEGCQMEPDQVDVARHQDVNLVFGAQFPDIDMRLTEEINAKELIETELYRPVGAYFLTRKGRASVGYTSPSLLEQNSLEFNSANLTNPTKIAPERSTSENFYNTVIYKYGYNNDQSEFLNNIISTSLESKDRIESRVKDLTIEAKAFAGEADVTNFFNSVSLRILDRYKFAATKLSLQPTYGAAYSVEIGDTALISLQDLKVFDDSTGRTDTFERVMEVVNKTMDITTGRIKLDFLDTKFGINDRYTSYGPSSLTGPNSTIDRIEIKKSFGTDAVTDEYEKWVSYFNEPIQVRDDNFTYQETVTLLGYDEADSNFLLITPLPTPPTEDFILELPSYDEQGERSKRLHASAGPQIAIVSGVDNFSFTVASVDTPKLFLGAEIDLHTEGYSSTVERLTVTEIVGDTITVEQDIGFTPDNTYLIDRVGFASDEGFAYVYI